jgi:hypothetical protein
MAVFTSVTLEDVDQWIKQFPLGRALALKGIASGIENTNYFLTTERGEYVLTIFENLNFEQLPFYLELMRHLAARGVLVPAPVPNEQVGYVLPCTASRPPSSPNWKAVRRWTRSRCIAPKWAQRWPACTWPGGISPSTNPICAACPGGAKWHRSFCPSWTALKPNC